MAKDHMFIAQPRRTDRSVQPDAFCPPHGNAAAGLAMSVPLRILFVGRRGLVEWRQLRAVIENLFADLVETKTIGDIASLCERGATQADIIVVRGTAARCGAKTRAKIRELCPLASTVYVTTADQPSDPSKTDPDAIYVVKSRPVPTNQILAAILDAMRRRICCLKLALRSSDTQTSTELNFLESLYLLTPQEERILVALRRGMPNKLIARHLQITVRTVKAHLTEIYRKTGATQRAELIVRCSELAAPNDGLPKDDIASFMARKDWPNPSPFARRPAPRAALGTTSGNPISAPHLPRVTPTRLSVPIPR